MVETKTSFFTFKKTIGNSATRLIDNSIPFYEANFHIQDNDVKYGDGVQQEATATADSVLDFKNGDIKDVWFKNAVADAVGVVVVVATVPLQYVKDMLRL